MGRAWGRGPPASRVGASDQAPHRTCRGPFAPRARGVEGSAMADGGSRRKKILPTTRRVAASSGQAQASGWILGTPQRAGFCGGRSPARWASEAAHATPVCGSASSRWLDRWSDVSRSAWRKATSCECADRHRRSEARKPGWRAPHRRTGPRKEGPQSAPRRITPRPAVQAGLRGVVRVLTRSIPAQRRGCVAGRRCRPRDTDARPASPAPMAPRAISPQACTKKPPEAASLCCGCRQRVYTVFAGAGVSGAALGSPSSARACRIEVAISRSIWSVKSS